MHGTPSHLIWPQMYGLKTNSHSKRSKIIACMGFVSHSGKTVVSMYIGQLPCTSNLNQHATAFRNKRAVHPQPPSKAHPARRHNTAYILRNQPCSASVPVTNTTRPLPTTFLVRHRCVALVCCCCAMPCYANNNVPATHTQHGPGRGIWSAGATVHGRQDGDSNKDLF